MRTPKQRFVESPARLEFEKLSAKPEFEEGIAAALLQLQHEMPEPIDPSRGWDQASRLAGAKRFVEILTSIHLKDEPRKLDSLPKLRSPQ